MKSSTKRRSSTGGTKERKAGLQTLKIKTYLSIGVFIWMVIFKSIWSNFSWSMTHLALGYSHLCPRLHTPVAQSFAVVSFQLARICMGIEPLYDLSEVESNQRCNSISSSTGKEAGAFDYLTQFHCTKGGPLDIKHHWNYGICCKARACNDVTVNSSSLTLFLHTFL
jgi:hypothetical protein